MNRILVLAMWIVLTQNKLSAQSKLSLENYYSGEQDLNLIVPIMHFQAKNNWYAELRHNYEDVNTVSLFAGKAFTGGNEVTFSIIPLLGYSIGKFCGPSLALNTETEWKKLFFSSQNQYSISTKVKKESFFFTWTEAGYSISEWLFTGITLQYTRLSAQNIFEPGLLAGLSFKNVSFPCYIFNPFQRKHYFVLGLNYEFSFKER